MEKEKKLPDDYYDVGEIVIEKVMETASISEIFYIKDLQQRKLFIDENIMPETVGDSIRHIMQFNREDMGIPVKDRKPILLYLSSNGGDVDSGFALVDTILASKTPVYTINLGYQYSMGFLLGLAGHKRFANKNAKFLMHDGTNFVWDSGAKAQDRMEFNKKLEKQIKQYVLSRSKLTEEEYDSKYRVEWYMFADEAKEKGFVDYIIGEDCEIDEVV